MRGLSDAEVRAFAAAFPDAASARPVLRAAGLPAGRDPSWAARDAEGFWFAVAELLEHGGLPGGRTALFAAALTWYPDNPVLTTGAAGGGVVWDVGWPRNPLFTGREDELSALRDRLVGSGSAAVLPVAVHGLGGVGKTQLAVEYCYRFRRDYELVWWVAAQDSAAALAGLARLAERVGVAVPGAAEESVRAVMVLLASGSRFGRWLLVLDNAGVPADPFGVLKAAEASGGHVLVTSRDHRWSTLARPVQVDVLPSMDAMTLLRCHVGQVADRDAGRIVAALGNLPLAVEQAGAFLATTAMTPTDYAGLLSTQLRGLMSRGAPAGVTPVAATWTVTLHQLDDPAVVMLARLWAHFGPEPIPLDLLRTDVAGVLPAPLDQAATDRIALAETVGRLLTLALVRRTEDADAVVMHRLIQDVLRDDTPAELRPVLRTAVCRLLAQGHPPVRDTPDAWPRYAQIHAHALAAGLVDDDDPDSQNMIAWLVWYLRARGDYPNSRRLADQAHQRSREILDADHPSTLTAAQQLAGVVRAQGDYPTARALLDDVLARCRRVLGENHPSTINAAHELAVVMRAQGDYSTARATFDEVLSQYRHILGEDHPSTLTAAANLAGVIRAQGDNSTARALLDDVLARRRRILGEDHPSTINAAHNLAAVVRAQGDDLTARALLDDALVRRRRVLGEDHLDTLAAAHNLAGVVRAQGDLPAARAMLDDVLVRRRRVLGEDHPDTLAAAHSLAAVVRAQGDDLTARALLDDVLVRRRRVLGEDHPDTLAAAHNLAGVVQAQGDLPTARAMLEDVLVRRCRVLGEDHPFTHAVRQALAAMTNNEAQYCEYSDQPPDPGRPRHAPPQVRHSS
ncbi:FxSxx-COOH system tetratricopeptide repeat protein [Pseudofrankia saprophytica]|uniref:FxSxx-COOH system tetratricopeptide repeat protein n=1 Tax=Pseudofrankia saprophytica TaxID=298655 RepID=UPI000234C7E6|nr:FxSxx-COOH system tetratricopeptide repeat protein [Pseudofrankia saprophytica]